VQWEYTIASLGVTITRELCLHRLRNACTIRYRVQGALPEGCYLESRPLFAMRDFHDLVHHDSQSLQLEHDGHNIRVRTSGFACTVHASKLNPAADASPRFVESVDVWKNFAYTFDRERGQDGREHLWSPGTFVSRLRAGAHKHAIALELEARTEADASLTSVRSLPSIEDHIQAEALRLAPMLEAASKGAPKTDQDVLAALVHAADQFVVVRGAGDAAKSHSTQSQSLNSQSLTSIIAGYPWFSDWGRDTMISLPGLLLSCGRFDEAHASLLAFARLRRKGLVPNCFDNGSGEAMYNTADASLWFLIACCRYAQATGDTKGLAELLPACFDVIEAYEGGTDFGIRVDAKDGLVIAGNRDTQLTWMDAKRDGVVFTPRNGKPVELSALWYAGLMGIAKLVESTSVQRARSLRSLADHTARHFEKTFWNDSLQCLFDLAPGEPGVQQYEAAFVRPNQVFATCLPESPLSKAKRAMVLERVHEQLLTPFGLRTLAAGSSGYRPFYEGPLFARDGAYHCGTVWPWLLGPYCEGLMRLNHFSSASRGQARSLLQPLLGELLGEAQHARPRAADQTAPRAAKHEQQTTLRLPVRTIAEVYDAEDVPELGRRRPEGCFAQAWSVAEVLRVLKLADAGEE
jgi:predicted glycogen debranching enzyme